MAIDKMPPRRGLKKLQAQIQSLHPDWDPIRARSLAKLRLTAQILREHIKRAAQAERGQGEVPDLFT